MSLSRCLISTRRSSSLKTRIGSKRRAKLCRMRRTIFLSAAVMDCALFRVRSWEHGGSAFDSDPTSVWAAVIRCMRCCSTPTRVSCFLLWGFHLAQSEPRRWWRSRQNIWLGKIRELGELVTGQVVGRTNRDEINIFRESQGGYGDMAFAAWLYEEAVKRGLGQRVEL